VVVAGSSFATFTAPEPGLPQTRRLDALVTVTVPESPAAMGCPGASISICV
jgi:hypothetical protein